VKEELVVLYKDNCKLHHKQLNEIFRYLARLEFPNNYPLLLGFVVEVMTSLAGREVEEMLASDELLPYLSLVKVIFKEYAERYMLHSKDAFSQCVSEPVRLAGQVL
jgi:hypothetical protein